MLYGETLHVQLVNDGVVPGRPWRPVVSPGKCGVDDKTFWHMGRAVALVDGEVGALVSYAVAEMGVRPPGPLFDTFRVRVQQQLRRVEPVALARFPGPVHPVTVALPGTRIRQVAMPYLVCLLRQHHALSLAVVMLREQAQLYLVGVLRAQRKVHSLPIPGSAERIRLTQPDS